MRIGLDPGDRLLLVISGVLLLGVSLAAVLFTPEPSGSPIGKVSTFSTQSDGAKAAYLLLQELGYKEERWSAPPTDLPEKADGAVLILADPFLPSTSEEKTALQSFVRRGGRVVATGVLSARMLGLTNVVPENNPIALWKEYYPRLPGPISYMAPSISMRAGASWKNDRPGDLEFYGERKGGAVVQFRQGRGDVIWWADSSPLSNYGLTQASNLSLFLNSVGAKGSAMILWDEYYHGERPNLWSYFEKTPLGWGLLQLSILAMAILLTYSRRSGPIAVPVAESRLSPIEFVETVGDLYARTRAAAGAVEIAYSRFRALLRRRLGSPPTAGFEKASFVRLEQGGSSDPGIQSVLSACESALKAGNLDEARSLNLVQALYDATRRLRLTDQGE